MGSGVSGSAVAQAVSKTPTVSFLLTGSDDGEASPTSGLTEHTMTVAESKAISVSIRCPFARAHEFLSTPENFPKWASGLGKSLRRSGDVWVAETPEGSAEVRFTPRNEFGVLDHVVVPGSGAPVHIPMRVIPNGDGCDVILTLFRQPGMSDAKFEQDADWVRRDLSTLKVVLEA